MKKIIHDRDIFDGRNECNASGGESTINVNEVTCMDCLKIAQIAWRRQVRTFTGQPLKNAKEGLKRVNKRIMEIK